MTSQKVIRLLPATPWVSFVWQSMPERKQTLVQLAADIQHEEKQLLESQHQQLAGEEGLGGADL